MLTTKELLEGRRLYEALSGLYRNTRQDEFFWFAFRRSSDWVQLDEDARSNGGIYIEVDGARWGVLVVDGAVALKSRQRGPGYRRLHAMVEHGMDWKTQPRSADPAEWEGRAAIRCQWSDDEMVGEAWFDAASGLVVRTSFPGEVVELTDLRFNDAVDPAVFEPPQRTISGWRGGIAYVQLNAQSRRCSASWMPISGPGDLHVPGPDDVTLDEATDWASTRSDDIRLSVERERS